MRVLMAGVFSEKSTNVAQADGFEQNGCRVIRYSYRERAIYLGCKGRDDELIRVVQEEQPDAVIFCKCNTVDIRVVQECNKYCPTVLWYMDTDNNTDAELLLKADYCKYVFCAAKISYDIITKQSMNKNIYLLEEGFDHLVDFPMPEEKKIYDVGFIGTIKDSRADYHNALGFNVFNNVFGKEFARTINQTKINLNFTKENGGTSDRLYRILACKGFVLSEPWPKMEESFAPDKDFILFYNIVDLKQKLKYYLDRPELRERTAEYGYNSVQKFSRIKWAERILAKIRGGNT